MPIPWKNRVVMRSGLPLCWGSAKIDPSNFGMSIEVRVSLVLVKTFLTIVETGSLVKASRYLNITQSTVTSRLKSLEAEVGQKLLHRQKSGIVLTASGIKFHRYAEAMANMWQQAMIETSLPKGMEAVCNLGCHPDLWPQVGRALVKKIGTEHPTTAMTVHTSDSSKLAEWLSVGVIDAALTYQSVLSHNMLNFELESEKLALYSTTPQSPVKGDPNYIYFDAGPEFGSQHATAYADAGIAKHTFASANWVLDFLLDHGGSAYLPTGLAHPFLQQKQLFCLSDAPQFHRNVYFVANATALPNWPWLPDALAASNHQQR